MNLEIIAAGLVGVVIGIGLSDFSWLKFWKEHQKQEHKPNY